MPLIKRIRWVPIVQPQKVIQTIPYNILNPRCSIVAIGLRMIFCLSVQDALQGVFIVQKQWFSITEVWIHLTERVSAFWQTAHKCLDIEAFFHSLTTLNLKPPSSFGLQMGSHFTLAPVVLIPRHDKNRTPIDLDTEQNSTYKLGPASIGRSLLVQDPGWTLFMILFTTILQPCALCLVVVRGTPRYFTSKVPSDHQKYFGAWP